MYSNALTRRRRLFFQIKLEQESRRRGALGLEEKTKKRGAGQGSRRRAEKLVDFALPSRLLDRGSRCVVS